MFCSFSFSDEGPLLKTLEFFEISHGSCQTFNFLPYLTLSTQYSIFIILTPSCQDVSPLVRPITEQLKIRTIKERCVFSHSSIVIAGSFNSSLIFSFVSVNISATVYDLKLANLARYKKLKVNECAAFCQKFLKNRLFIVRKSCMNNLSDSDYDTITAKIGQISIVNPDYRSNTTLDE